MLSKEALDEIEQWRRHTISPQQQLDRRWLERYRELASYDGHWWLAHAGPFTEEEQRQWNRLSTLPLDESTKDRFSQLLVQSRQRELAAALNEQREPHLCYPAINSADVCRRIAAFDQYTTKYFSSTKSILRYYELCSKYCKMITRWPKEHREKSVSNGKPGTPIWNTARSRQ